QLAISNWQNLIGSFCRRPLFSSGPPAFVSFREAVCALLRSFPPRYTPGLSQGESGIQVRWLNHMQFARNGEARYFPNAHTPQRYLPESKRHNDESDWLNRTIHVLGNVQSGDMTVRPCSALFPKPSTRESLSHARPPVFANCQLPIANCPY